MTIECAEIFARYRDRAGNQAEYITKSRQLTDAYNGEIAVPLPELNQVEDDTTANILKQGLNQTAMRIASTGQNVQYPPGRAGVETHEKRSREKRLVTLGWWHHNKLRLQDRLRARWLIGYAAAPVQIRAPRSVDKYRIPVWEARSPLMTFPSSGLDATDITPADCIFAVTRSAAWLRSTYPDVHMAYIEGLPHADKLVRPDDRFEVLEYVDHEELVTVLVGTSRDPLRVRANYGVRGNFIVNIGGGDGHNRWVAELERVPNRAGMCTAVVPGLINLDKPTSNYAGLPAMMALQAKLWALQLHAIQRGVFAKEWLVAPEGGNAQIVVQADPYTGQVGEIQGGDIREHRVDPGFASLQAIRDLSDFMRQDAGIPMEFMAGASPGVRTGKRGSQIVSEVVDFPVQEAQEILAASREEENIRAIAVAKGYARKVSFYVPTSKTKSEPVTYDARTLFDSDANHCFYAHAGTDINTLSVVGLQMVGADVMARQDLMEMHPLIEDAEQTKDRIIGERLTRAILMSLETRAASGEVPEVDAARIKKLVVTNKMELEDAIAKVQEEAQERQAEQVPPDDPLAQPGLANPGAGAEAAMAPAGPPGLEDLIGQLTAPGVM